MRNPSRSFNSSPEIIRLTVMMYIRYPLSLRRVEDILFERGIDKLGNWVAVLGEWAENSQSRIIVFNQNRLLGSLDLTVFISRIELIPVH